MMPAMRRVSPSVPRGRSAFVTTFAVLILVNTTEAPRRGTNLWQS